MRPKISNSFKTDIMKKHILLLILICISLTSFGKTRDTLKYTTFSPKTNVKLNTLVCIGVINPAFELRLSNKFSIQLEGLGVISSDNYLGTGYPLQMWSCFLEPRWYPKRVFNGFFLGANVGSGAFRLNKNILYKFFGWSPDLNYKKYEHSVQIGANLMAGITLGYTYTFKCNPHWAVEANWSMGRQWAIYEDYLYKDEKVDHHIPNNGSAEYMPFYRGGIYISYKW